MQNNSGQLKRPTNFDYIVEGSSPSPDEFALIDYINNDKKKVEKMYMLATAALASDREEDFQRHFSSYRKALIAHLKIVSTGLYVPLRRKLSNSVQLQDVLYFEKKATVLNQRIAQLFKDYDEIKSNYDPKFKLDFHRVGFLLSAHQWEEGVTLYPMYQHYFCGSHAPIALDKGQYGHTHRTY